LIITVKLEPQWHIYSQKEQFDGPLPTLFNFKKSKEYTLSGTVIEPQGKTDKMWEEMDVKVISFEGTVVFKQKIKILTTQKFTVKANVSYMVCKEACIPGDKEIFFVVN